MTPFENVNSFRIVYFSALTVVCMTFVTCWTVKIFWINCEHSKKELLRGGVGGTVRKLEPPIPPLYLTKPYDGFLHGTRERHLIGVTDCLSDFEFGFQAVHVSQGNQNVKIGHLDRVFERGGVRYGSNTSWQSDGVIDQKYAYHTVDCRLYYEYLE